MVAETYPCEKCGKPRTKAEGGTTFTMCDECWEKARPWELRHPVGSQTLALGNVAQLQTTIADQAREIEALKAERDNWRDLAGLHQIASAAHKNRVARLEGLISAITCDEADAESCERYCAHGYGPLHAEARAIREARKS